MFRIWIDWAITSSNNNDMLDLLKTIDPNKMWEAISIRDATEHTVITRAIDCQNLITLEYLYNTDRNKFRELITESELSWRFQVVAEEGNIKMLEFLVGIGHDQMYDAITKKNSEGYNFITRAFKKQDLKFITYLYESDHLSNYKEEFSKSINPNMFRIWIDRTITSSNNKILELLKTIDPNKMWEAISIRDATEHTVITRAITCQNLITLKYLYNTDPIKFRELITESDFSWWFQVVAQNGNLEMLKFLVGIGHDQMNDAIRNNKFIERAFRRQDLEFITYLYESDKFSLKELTSINDFKFGLELAMKKEKIKIFKYFLANWS